MTSSIGTRPSDATRRLLIGGLLSGPLFVIVAAAQVLTRDGFDLSRHPLSLLSLGDLGWIQVANFIVAGMLAIGFAIGARRVLRAGRGSRWVPILIGIYGAGLVAGGIFVADPALGFPPGTPDGIPSTFSWHGTIHAIAPPVAFLALIGACFVLARRDAAEARRGWAVYGALTGVSAFVLSAPIPPEGASIRLAVAVAIGAAWVSALAVRLLVGEGSGKPGALAPAATY
jgi:hypothetical protein